MREPLVALNLLGTRVDIAVSGSGAQRLADTISEAWERCLADPEGSPAATVVELLLDDDDEVVSGARERSVLAGSDELRLMHTLSSHLTVTAIAARLGELWMLHACALADPVTGATVVLVGPSGAGKTTVAATLGRHLGYLTDETAAIESDGTLLPYPKPLSVLVGGKGPKRQESPTKLGLLDAPATPWLAAIALLDRTGTGDPSVESVRTVEALPALAEQTSALQLLDRPLHLVAGHLDRTGGLRRVTYRESEDLLPVVAELIEGAT